MCRIGGETDAHRHGKERNASQPYSEDSEQNTDNNSLANTEHEYEYTSSLSCMSEHVLITAEACLRILIGSMLGVEMAALHTMLVRST